MAIDLNLTDEQQLLMDSARGFLETHSPISLARKAEQDGADFPRELWGKMAEQGWLAMPFPEEYDGLETSAMDSYVLYHELGRQLAPAPYLETVALGGALIEALGDEAQKQAWLPAIGAGEAVLTLALTEPDGAHGPDAVRMAARSTADGFRLTGHKVLVAYAGSADVIVCAARTGGETGADGISLFLVDPKADGVTLEPTPSMTGVPMYAIAFDEAPAEPLGPIGTAWPVLDEVCAKAAVLQAATVIGAAERVLEITVDYAKERVQFGQPIGKHQAVQYLCTDIAIEHHFTRLLTLHAIWRIDSGRPFLREASLAKASASKTAAGMTFAAQEVHAGIGFMIDYDLQLYTRRAKHWEYYLGDARYHLERVPLETI